MFALFAIAFRFGAMGGGDVKMAAALALWLPLAGVVKLLVIMSIAGGVLTLAMLVRAPDRRRPPASPKFLTASPSLLAVFG